jgi:FkbM family methyltransferase
MKYKISNLMLLINLLKYKGLFLKKQYSKNGEDLYLKKIFKNKKYGNYIDIGAYHPYRLSNTYLLYKKGWEGINIDINKRSIDLFNIARPNDINLNIAISNKKEKKIFYYKKELYPMNTLNKEFGKKFIFRSKETVKKGFVMSQPFSYITKKIKKNIDLLNIDVEGHEYQVLKGINFKKNKFKIILIEISHFNKKSNKNAKRIRSLLLRNNYKYVKDLGETSIYKS